MSYLVDRRQFLKTAGALAAGTACYSRRRDLFAKEPPIPTPCTERLGWSLCCQLYTFRAISFYEALETIASLGIKHVEPCFFLKLDAKRPSLTTSEALSPALRKELKQRLADYGVRMTNYYAKVESDASAARNAFEFAKEMGTQTIVAEPPPAALDMVEKLCNEYDINLAIHNHPKTPNYNYWKPENVLAACKSHGPRIGACCDTGHWVRSAMKPVDCLKTMQGRIITVHMKDVGEWGKPPARDVPLGTGLADYAAVLKELHRQQFKGVLTVEYEHQSPQLVDDVTQCIQFVEKTACGIQPSR